MNLGGKHIIKASSSNSNSQKGSRMKYKAFPKDSSLILRFKRVKRNVHKKKKRSPLFGCKLVKQGLGRWDLLHSHTKNIKMT